MSSSPEAWAVIVAAGQAERFAGSELKQFVPIAGKPMALWSIEAFLSAPRVLGVTLVVPPNTLPRPPRWLTDLREVELVAGGQTRTDSVRLGVESSQRGALVAVHDAARPLITPAVISRVITAADLEVGAIAARRVTDTLKASEDERTVESTVDRAGLWRAETPQVFGRELLLDVHRRARMDRASATDCAGLCERYGVGVRLVEIEEPNIKVTHTSDLALVETILGSQRTSDEGTGAS